MKLEITAHIHLHGNEAELLRRFDRVDRFLTSLTLKGNEIMSVIQDAAADLVVAKGELVRLRAGVDALEAKITDLASKVVSPEDQAALLQLAADAKELKEGITAGADDAGDGVDEGAAA